MKKDSTVFIDDILESIDVILTYVKDVNKNDFLYSDDLEKTIMRQDAIIRRIEIIGEASKSISQSIKNKYSDVNWKEIAGMRNMLIHKYFEVDLNLTWEVATKDIKKLKKQMLVIKKSLK